MDLGEILKVYRKKQGLTQEQLSVSSGVSLVAIKKYEGGVNTNITLKTIEKIAAGLMIDAIDLINEIYGQEPINTTFETLEIDILSAKVGAGGGIYNYEVSVIGQKILDTTFFKVKPKEKDLRIVQIDGDSMEPTLLDGTFVVIDITQTDKSDGIYALELDGQLLIKRLQFNIDSTISIISDNKIYAVQTFNPNETQVNFKILGRKVLIVSK